MTAPTDYLITLERINGIVNDPDPNELHPDSQVVAQTVVFLDEARRQLQGTWFPRAAVAVNESRDLYLYWENGTRRLQLTWRTGESSPVLSYQAMPDGHGLMKQATAADLARLLLWLTGASDADRGSSGLPVQRY